MDAKEKMKKAYKIEFVDRILDPVHGFIDITQVEKDIIDLPIFKRLQSIKQLSLTSWVFPGAEHTRYMHSLGVMHIVDLMAKNLKRIDNTYRFSDAERQLLRLAGLLHDIGHYPLSHVTETVYKDNDTESIASLTDKRISVKKDIDDDFNLNKYKLIDYMKSRYSKPMHHETIGAKIIETDSSINSIIKEYCPFIDIHDIMDIIVGCVDRNHEIAAMVQLLHSELDADGIDYILRDATFSGTSYGGFEFGLLLRNLVVATYNGIEIVGIKAKGISVVDQYLISKYFSYTQVIFNRHVAIYDTMAEIFSTALIGLDKSPYPSKNTVITSIKKHESNDDFLQFTDRIFWSQLDALKRNDLEGYVQDYIVAIHNKLTHYQELEMVRDNEFIITSNNKDEVYKRIVASAIYNKISSDQSDHSLFMYLKKGFTSELPENVYKERLKLVDQSIETDRAKFIDYNKKRLLEGVAIIGTDNSIALLVDDSRSIMSHLYSTNTYIIREYKID